MAALTLSPDYRHYHILDVRGNQLLMSRLYLIHSTERAVRAGTGAPIAQTLGPDCHLSANRPCPAPLSVTPNSGVRRQIPASAVLQMSQKARQGLCKRLHQGILGEEKGGGMDGQALLHLNTKEKDEQICRSLQDVQTRKSCVTAPAQLLPRRAV